jgi:hypothetical protein
MNGAHGASAPLDFQVLFRDAPRSGLLGAHALGAEAHQSAMIDALRKGRMRVPMEFVDGVVTLIGREAASECSSLPRTARQLNATFPASTRSVSTSM